MGLLVLAGRRCAHSTCREFSGTFSQAQLEGALAYSPLFDPFHRVMLEEMDRFGQPEFFDSRIEEVREKLEGLHVSRHHVFLSRFFTATKAIMRENIDRVLEVGTRRFSMIGIHPMHGPAWRQGTELPLLSCNSLHRCTRLTTSSTRQTCWSKNPTLSNSKARR